MKRIRKRIEINGRVQGVGFRPFIHRLSTELALAGIVGNDPRGVFIEIEGPMESVEAFVRRLPGEIPPLASIARMDVEDIPALDEHEFRIELSRASGEQTTEISPDVCTCADCLNEMLDPADRRLGYPFINCTNCGPRYSIIRSVPYDRPKTTMAAFTMCPDCQAEYDDPLDRRFHAQPNACPVCGPKIWLTDRDGNALDGDPVEKTVELLRNGHIVAVKGLGGFHLACDARNDEAVKTLRARKAREAKPFALMVGFVEEAESLGRLNDAARAAIQHWSRPIVLLPKVETCDISPAVAAGCSSIGVMLPYTPLHFLIFAQNPGPLVMTSGNPSDEPLSHRNDEAISRLNHIADYFLLHDREIERRVDDSVVLAADLGTARQPEPVVTPVRRSRGFVPEPIHLTHSSPKPVLAVGGEMKSTVCLLNGSRAILSEHLGELHNPKAYRNFVGTVDLFKNLFKVEPEIIAYDPHPAYASTMYVKDIDVPLTAVQHHHAHMVSCMAENGITGEVVGVSCDGTGYGTDGAIWGCEILAGDEADFTRAAHLKYFPLFGGDAAARATWRPAAGLLHTIHGKSWLENHAGLFRNVEQDAVQTAASRFENAPARIPQTSSLGRLFDAVAFLLGIAPQNRFEAEAAMALEEAAWGVNPAVTLPWSLNDGENGDPLIMDPSDMITAIIEQRHAGISPATLARAFHDAASDMIASAAIETSRRRDIGRIVLSGGSFANRLLLNRIYRLLIEAGCDVYLHTRVPAGDGGISLGQAVVAAERIKRGLL